MNPDSVQTDPTRFTEAELMMKHQRGIDAIEAGQGIRVTMEQLEAMADSITAPHPSRLTP